VKKGAMGKEKGKKKGSAPCSSRYVEEKKKRRAGGDAGKIKKKGA